MEELENIFHDSEKIRGICPKTGEEATFRYCGTVTIRNPKKKIRYDFHCSVCNNRHYLHEIENFRLNYKQD